jgi:serine protease Do
MKSLRYILPLFLAAGVAQPLLAQQEKQVIRRERRAAESEKDVHRERKVIRELPGHDGEKEKVTFLGVETAPVSRTVAAQLGLEPEIGLVVTRVQKDSAATDVLKEHDILMKFEDQLLIDSRQFSVLIRSKKPGDQVTLTLRRGGKEQKVTVKLGEREVPKMFGIRGLEFGPDMHGFQFFNGDGPGMARLRELPGIAREELGDVFRMLGDEKGNWFKSPRVHVLRRGNQGSTILNLNEGNFVFSDDEGSVEVNAANGKRQLTVKDPSGKVTYQGSIASDEERKQLPPQVRERLNEIEGIDIDVRVGEDFKQEGAAIEKPNKAKISTKIPGSPKLSVSPRAF